MPEVEASGPRVEAEQGHASAPPAGPEDKPPDMAEVVRRVVDVADEEVPHAPASHQCW